MSVGLVLTLRESETTFRLWFGSSRWEPGVGVEPTYCGFQSTSLGKVVCSPPPEPFGHPGKLNCETEATIFLEFLLSYLREH